MVALVVALAACGESSTGPEDGEREGTTLEAPTTTATSEQIAPTTTSLAPTTSTGDTTTMIEAVAWPRIRNYHGMVHIAGADLVLLYGGNYGANYTSLYDSWLLDPTSMTWTELETLPLRAPAGSASAYDSESGRVVYLQTSDFYAVDDPATWSYDPMERTWTEMAPALQPKLGIGARMVYDSESDRIIAFGGITHRDDPSPDTPETWAYDHNTDAWEEMSPATHPEWVNFHGMAYDSESDRTILVDLDDLNEDAEPQLWAYDYNTNTWEQLPVAEDAAGISTYTTAEYDPTSDRVIVFGGLHVEEKEVAGGTVSELTPHNEMWLYDYNTNSWEQGPSNELSGPIAFHDMVWLDSTQSLVVFGVAINENDDYAGTGLWVYDATTDTWTGDAVD